MLTLVGLNWVMLEGLLLCSSVGWGCVVRGWFPVLGGLFLRVYCGLCGGKGIYGILKGKNARLFNLNLSCCVLYMNGGKLMVLGQRWIS